MSVTELADDGKACTHQEILQLVIENNAINTFFERQQLTEEKDWLFLLVTERRSRDFR